MVSRHQPWEEELLTLGFEAGQLKSYARVLGVDFHSKRHFGQSSTREVRLTHSLGVASRLQRAKLPLEIRRHLWQSRVISKACWGHFLKAPPRASFRGLQAIKKNVLYLHQSGSTALQNILEGHRCNLNFQASYQAIGALMRTKDWWPKLWNSKVQTGTWLGHARLWLKSLGWIERSPFAWCWSHPTQGLMNWMREGPDEGPAKWHHLIRESWRLQQHTAFLNSSRRDSVLLQGWIYDETACQKARQLFEHATSHERAVMVGAAHSSAYYQKRKRGAANNVCTKCGQNVVPDWHHLAWECAHFHTQRPPRPQSAVQRRLGWPPRGQSYTQAKSTLAWLGHIREQVWEPFDPGPRD